MLNYAIRVYIGNMAYRYFLKSTQYRTLQVICLQILAANSFLISDLNFRANIFTQ